MQNVIIKSKTRASYIQVSLLICISEEKKTKKEKKENGKKESRKSLLFLSFLFFWNGVYFPQCVRSYHQAKWEEPAGSFQKAKRIPGKAFFRPWLSLVTGTVSVADPDAPKKTGN